MAKSPEEMEIAMLANLKEKTGKTLPQWLKLTKSVGLEKHGQLVKFLKGDHGVTHGFASLIAHKTLQAGSSAAAPGAPDLIDAQYSGDKEALRLIYESIISVARKFGKDMEISPKKTYVSLRRNKQFALIQPSTKTRVDVGINLKGTKPTKRLEASGSFNAMVSHRVRLTRKAEVDADLKKWLKEAYEKA